MRTLITAGAKASAIEPRHINSIAERKDFDTLNWLIGEGADGSGALNLAAQDGKVR